MAKTQVSAKAKADVKADVVKFPALNPQPQAEKVTSIETIRVETPVAREYLTQRIGDAPSMGVPAATPRTLPVAASCTYFDSGDIAREPLPAIVFRTDDSGVLTLNVFLDNGAMLRITSVYRIDDPRLDANPTLRNKGCWDTIERTEQRRVTRERTRRELAQKNAAERRQREEAARNLRNEQAPRLIEMVMVQKLTVDTAISVLNNGGNHWNIGFAQTYLSRVNRSELMDLPAPRPDGLTEEQYAEAGMA